MRRAKCTLALASTAAVTERRRWARAVAACQMCLREREREMGERR
jgi:hypothetical protein